MYAQGDYGVGSDLDLLIVLNSRAIPFERRMALLPLESLPVPAEALVYALEEWCALPPKTLEREVVWIWGRAGFC